MKKSRINTIIIITLLLSIASLILEHGEVQTRQIFILTNIVDFTVLFLFILELILEIVIAPQKKRFFRENLLSVLFLGFFIVLFTINKMYLFSGTFQSYSTLPYTLLILRNLFVLLKIFGRMRKLGALLQSVTLEPARTVLFIFILIIFTGAILLMLPFASSSGKNLPFIDAFFTSTSAVCVTGLIVVDTATAFSTTGQLIILTLIQIGGLGIMILSFFIVFVLRRKMSINEKYLVSYVISERDMTTLRTTLKRIIALTFGIEGAGACILFIGFAGNNGFSLRTLFLSVFHAISAFCNAGFSLFSDSLEQYASSGTVVITVAVLIILGGLSFFVILNSWGFLQSRFKNLIFHGKSRKDSLFLNSKVVLIGTIILIVLGMFLFYALEHTNTLADMDVKTQYLSAFFQSVTLRTAGFNTIPFHSLVPAVYAFMMLFMFIGAASGSTAGGIKINSIAILLAYLKSVLTDQDNIILMNHSIRKEQVLRAFIIFAFGATAVFGGFFLLLLFEKGPAVPLLFETVSAFGTVGLSAGVTPSLGIGGKIVIILLMFSGRLGPLTLLAAATQKTRRLHIDYPQGEITIG